MVDTEKKTIVSRPTLTSDAKDEDKVAEVSSTSVAKAPPIALQCPYCAKESFSSLAALGLHVQTLHGNYLGPVKMRMLRKK